MASSRYGGGDDIPIDAQFNIEEGQFPNIFQSQESQTMERDADQTANPTPGGRTRGRGRNGGGTSGRGGEASGSASASVASSKKKCKRTSAVWEHFNTFEEVDNNGNIKYVAQCKYCGEKLQGNTIHGTTHLRRHSEKCLQKQGGGDQLRQTQLSFDHQTGGLSTWKYDPQVDRMEMARLIATLDQPLSFPEQRNWQRYIKIVHNPNAQFFSRTTLRKDALKLYKQEKEALINLLHSTSGCVALTADIWSAVANKDYLAVTGHYYKGFDLDKRILGFKCVIGSHTANLIYNTILSVIDEYSLRDRIMAITLDNATANTKAIELFENDLSLFGTNDIFHQRCACHIINLIVKSGLKSMSGHIKRIRDNIAWIQGSNQRIQDWFRFLQACNQNPRALALDMPIRWNSTYIMLEQCIPYKDAITNYVSAKLGIGFIDETDWQIAELLYNFLGRFHEVTLKLSGTYYPTSPLALGELLRMSILFSEFRTHEVLGVPIASMEKKFKKYWSKLPMLYGFGVIFDPRLKLEGLESGLDNLGEFLAIDTTDQYPIIKEKIYSLYISYESRFRKTPCVEEPQQQDDNPHSFLNVFRLSKKKKKK